MKVPEEIKVAAKDLINDFGCNFDYLGKREGADYYMFIFPEGSTTGFPFIFEHKGGAVREISGFDSLDFLRLFGEDAGEVCVE